jgi:hypothetical protein
VADDNKFFVGLGLECDFYFKHSVMEDWMYELSAKTFDCETQQKFLTLIVLTWRIA